MKDIVFLSEEDGIFLGKEEIEYSHGFFGIRIIICWNHRFTPRCLHLITNFCLYKIIFEMAATYLCSIALNHPFIDGNKQTAVLAALVFLEINGYEVNENHEDELADLVLDFLNKNKKKEDIIVYFKSTSKKIGRKS